MKCGNSFANANAAQPIQDISQNNGVNANFQHQNILNENFGNTTNEFVANQQQSNQTLSEKLAKDNPIKLFMQKVSKNIKEFVKKAKKIFIDVYFKGYSSRFGRLSCLKYEKMIKFYM
ncbi:MAG: hypothetical protein ACK5HL_01340 [Bacilli bacterium]